MLTNHKYSPWLLVFGFTVALIALTRFTPLKPHWGSLEMRQAATITVTGEARETRTNQVAQFTAGFEAIEVDKDTALSKANQAMNEVIEQVKTLGVEAADIQTENANVYQEIEYERVEILIYPPMPDAGTAKKGQWRANNSVSIKLRNIDQAEQLLSLLQNSGANYVYGPNFGLDQDQIATDTELVTQAVAAAKTKAEQIAAASGQRVGKMVSFYENETYPVFRGYAETMPMAMGSSKDAVVANVEPGSSQLHKTVTVTFELY